jgi:hypothetical protein
MEYDQRIIVRFLHKDGVQSDQIRTRLKAQFEDDTYSLRSVQLWCQYVRQGREDLRDEERSGKPSLEFIDSKIIACHNSDPFHPAYSIAEAIGISHSTVLNHLRDSLGMKNFHFRCIPQSLIDDLRQRRVAVCNELLPMLEAQNKKQFRDLVAGDESWFMLEYEHGAQWGVFHHEVLPKVRPGIQTRKFMFTVVWDAIDFHVANLLTSQCSFDNDYFFTEILQPLVDKLFPQGKTPCTSRLMVHFDNYRLHFSKCSQRLFYENPLRRVLQPPYSPDLALSDF